MSMLGLDRKQMERERLDRLQGTNVSQGRKRDRSISPPALKASRKALKIDPIDDSPEASDISKLAALVSHNQRARKPPSSNASNASLIASSPPGLRPAIHTTMPAASTQTASLAFPAGVVKKTWAFGQPRDGHDIKLEEVIESASVRTAVLSAFQWDLNWVLSKLKTPPTGGRTKCIFVMHAKSQDERIQYRELTNGQESWLRMCLPPMDGQIWCMHSKLMLLFHEHKLRIAIPTANLLNFDWGETGQMENSVFIIDLPRVTQNTSQTLADLTEFGKELMFFIEKQTLQQDVRDGVLNFDFSATARMAFVHTIGGCHYERHGALRTGLHGLSKAIRALNLTTLPNELEIDFAASSIGQLNDSQLRDFYAASLGQDLIAQATKARSQAAVRFFTAASSIPSAEGADVRSKLRIYFPTRDTVQASTAGSAGTICLQRNYFEASSFPREIFRDYISRRQGLLSHNKILLARSKTLAWAYIGSANMSKSAWGELPRDRQEKKITCRNWECGVVLPVDAEKLPSQRSSGMAIGDDVDTESDDEVQVVDVDSGLVSMDVFRGLVDVPFHVPGDKYFGREPWYFKE